jgi:hypothetical protein
MESIRNSIPMRYRDAASTVIFQEHARQQGGTIAKTDMAGVARFESLGFEEGRDCEIIVSLNLIADSASNMRSDRLF